MAVTGQEAAAAGVKSLIFFHDDDGGLHGIQRRSAALEHVPSFRQRPAHAIQVGFNHVIRDGPGSAMDHEYRQLSQSDRPLRNLKTRETEQQSLPSAMPVRCNGYG